MASSIRRFKGRVSRPVSEINVAPFVDVMLVLVVIFMVAAPLLTIGVPVDLPQANVNPINQEAEPLVITVNRDGEIFVQDAAVDADTLVPRLIAIADNNRQLRIFVRGDRAIEYGRVMQVMGIVNQAGFTRVALIAVAPDVAAAN